jgi:hypothetical protein
MRPSRLKFIKITPLCCQTHQIIFQNYTFQHLFRKFTSRGPCLKPPLLTILTSSLLYCHYQRDERAKPGNLLTKLCSFSLPLQQSVSHFSHYFSLSPTLLICFHLSFQSSLWTETPNMEQGCQLLQHVLQ